MGKVDVHAQGFVQLATDQPHTVVFFLATMAFIVVTLLPNGSRGDLTRQRKIYWGGTFSAAICAFIAALPNLATGLIVATLCVFCLTLSAYFSTQLIKVGGRVVAFDSAQELPAEAFGRGTDPYSPHVSAAKAWWIFLIFLGLWIPDLLEFAVGRGSATGALIAVGFLLVVGALLGYMDGSRQQRVARGQYLPFGIVSVISAGIFTVCYLLAHSVGFRMRRPSQ